ncbi:transglycosylase SLT domain-containing protein [sulfur-oxidizing endosymbiont of Gigantopelta aegis]|uniref:transglycosylase SLT domain-containing protein n=1 Tax=sulfur-oxidizing endosymbiont of Gigantopelta aegis TaxID=2794934 RepID=UPI0018DBA0AA|nr:transglycosylase SLT domain-containing protein [sulfur-oxidizing endosymbiont of Gigantopelta aegis]
MSSSVFANNTPTIDLTDHYKKQRSLFLKAETALKKQQHSRYKKYYQQLDGYPLQAYLKYKEYRNKLSRLNEKQVLQFFKDYKNTPYEGWLRTAWLDKQAKREQWQQYLNAYTPQKSTQRQCHQVNALLKTGHKTQAYKLIPNLWLVGESQPRSCDPIFKAFKQAGKMTPELLWGRINIAMQKGRTSLASYLARSLNKSDQAWVKEWGKIYRQPAQVLKSRLLAQTPASKQKQLLRSTIQVQAVERMARRQAKAAIKLLSALEKKHQFSSSEQDQMYRAIGMKLAYKHGDNAWFWLDKISDNNSDETVRQWRARSAIREGIWPAITSSINRMTEEEQKSFRWQYWLAAGKEQRGDKKAAQADWSELAQNRSYYGFLAADKMAMPYEFHNTPLATTNKSLQRIATHPGIQRAREFYLLGRTIEARREWYYTTRKQMPNDDRAIAAKVAQHWGWHNRAIITMAHTKERNDIDLRFPILQKERVIKYSHKHKLQPAYTLAVIRRESAFATDARSRVGALGLMQIMPATGKVIARKLKVKFNSKNQLLSPETNVKFGTKYLNMMLKKFYKQPALASAAYNAGGHRVRAWLPDGQDMKADRWIESIPFKETREYVSSILAYTAIYEQRLDLPQTRLSAVMPDVPKKKK